MPRCEKLGEPLKTGKKGQLGSGNHVCLPGILDLVIEFFLTDGGRANEMDWTGMLVVARHTRHQEEGELARFLGDLWTRRTMKERDIATDCFVAAGEGRKGAGVTWLDELGLAAMNDPFFAVDLGGKSVIETLERNGRMVGRRLRHSAGFWD